MDWLSAFTLLPSPFFFFFHFVLWIYFWGIQIHMVCETLKFHPWKLAMAPHPFLCVCLVAIYCSLCVSCYMDLWVWWLNNRIFKMIFYWDAVVWKYFETHRCLQMASCRLLKMLSSLKFFLTWIILGVSWWFSG